MVRFSHQILCIQSDFLDACSRFLSEIADRELVWERGFLIFLTWNFRWMSLSYLYIFFLVNGETLIWTSRGARKLGYDEKWQRQRTNISQWLWRHGEKTQVDVKSGAKLMETFSFFLRRIFPKNVGQEDPTVWIGYIFMIAISLFHSRISIYCFLCRMTFCREFL